MGVAQPAPNPDDTLHAGMDHMQIIGIERQHTELPAWAEGFRDHGTVPLRANHHAPRTWAAALWAAGWLAAELATDMDGDYQHPDERMEPLS